MRESRQTTKVLQARNRMIKLQTCATLQYKGSFLEQNCRYRGRGPSRGAEAEVQTMGTETDLIHGPRGQNCRPKGWGPETRRIVRPRNLGGFCLAEF